MVNLVILDNVVNLVNLLILMNLVILVMSCVETTVVIIGYCVVLYWSRFLFQNLQYQQQHGG